MGGDEGGEARSGRSIGPMQPDERSLWPRPRAILLEAVERFLDEPILYFNLARCDSSLLFWPILNG